jgi:hypothetical protein
VYNQNLTFEISGASFETISLTFKLEQGLCAWEEQVDSPLHTMHSFDACSENLDLTRSRVVLCLRFLNLKVLLHRPVLTRYLDRFHLPTIESGANSSTNQSDINSLQLMLHSSTEIITIVHAALSSSAGGRQFLGAWLFTEYYGKSASNS